MKYTKRRYLNKKRKLTKKRIFRKKGGGPDEEAAAAEQLAMMRVTDESRKTLAKWMEEAIDKQRKNIKTQEKTQESSSSSGNVTTISPSHIRYVKRITGCDEALNAISNIISDYKKTKTQAKGKRKKKN